MSVVIVETVTKLGSGTDVRVYDASNNPQQQLRTLLERAAEANRLNIEVVEVDGSLEVEPGASVEAELYPDCAILSDSEEGVTWHWNVVQTSKV